MLFLGVYLVWRGIQLWLQYSYLSRHGIATTGEVTGINKEQIHSGGVNETINYRYTPIVKYKGAKPHKITRRATELQYTGSATLGNEFLQHHIAKGDKVNVLYDPEDSENAVVVLGWRPDISAYVRCSFGLLLVAGGLIPFRIIALYNQLLTYFF